MTNDSGWSDAEIEAGRKAARDFEAHQQGQTGYSESDVQQGYKRGGIVKRTGPALVHKGERVVAKSMKLGGGGRFAKLKGSLARKGVSDPGAVAASIGRKKYGAKRMAAWSAKGRARASGGTLASNIHHAGGDGFRSPRRGR